VALGARHGCALLVEVADEVRRQAPGRVAAAVDTLVCQAADVQGGDAVESRFIEALAESNA